MGRNKVVEAYNLNYKLGYIETAITKNRAVYNAIKRTFELIKPYEEEKGKDICRFTKTELEALFNAFPQESKEDESFVRIYNYIEWCVQHELADKNNSYDYVEHLIRTSMVEDLAQLNRLCEDSNKKHLWSYANSIAVFNEMIVRLLYDGLEAGEIVKLEKKHLVDDSVVISPVTGERFSVDPVTMKWCTRAEEMNSVEVLQKERGVKSEYELVATRYIVRPANKTKSKEYEDEPVPIKRYINRRFLEMSEDYRKNTGMEFHFAIQKIQMSGKFARVFEQEEAGVAVARDNIMELGGREVYHEVGNRFENYLLWKRVFHTKSDENE